MADRDKELTGPMKIIKDPVPSSMERLEDVVFETLIRRWTEERKFQRVEVIAHIYGVLLEERHHE